MTTNQFPMELSIAGDLIVHILLRRLAQTAAPVNRRMVKCAFCMEDQLISFDGNQMVCPALVQNSTLFAARQCVPFNEPPSNIGAKLLNIFAPVDLPHELHVSTCSHLIHFSCYNQIMGWNKTHARARPPQILNTHMLNVEADEYLCPVCKRMSNCVLPVFPPAASSLTDVCGFSMDSGNMPAHSASSSADAFDKWVGNLSALLVGQQEGVQSPQILPDKSQLTMLQKFLNIFGLVKTRKDITDTITDTNIPPSIRHWEMLKPLLNALERAANEKESANQSAAEPKESTPFARLLELLNVLRSCSSVVRSLAAILEAKKKPLFGEFNIRQRECLINVVRLAMVMPFNCQPSALRVLVRHLLTPLLTLNAAAPISLDGAAGPSNARTIQLEQAKSPLLIRLERALRADVGIMQIDMLTLAVELVLCIGWTRVSGNHVLHGMHETETGWKVADGSVDELHSIRLTLLAYIFQVVELHEPEHDVSASASTIALPFVDEDKQQQNGSDFAATIKMLRHLFPHYHLWQRSQQSAERNFYERIRQAVVSFLRPLAILYNTITLAPPPESLKDQSLDNFVPLCHFLGLPSTLADLLAGSQVEELFKMWQSSKQGPSDQKIGPHFPLRLNLLIELPDAYSQLIARTENFSCPNGNRLNKPIPNLCLNCGQMLCSQRDCCREVVNGWIVGPCTAHLIKCQSSTGVFFQIGDRKIICLLATNGGGIIRGCFKSDLYIGSHLNREIHTKLQFLCLDQDLGEEIINQFERNNRNIAIRWYDF